MARRFDQQQVQSPFASRLARGERQWGDRFDPSELTDKFVPYFDTGDRIKVHTSYGEDITGTVSTTTGWRPAFLLVRRSNAMGSSDLLSDRDTVVAVKRGRYYVPVS